MGSRHGVLYFGIKVAVAGDYVARATAGISLPHFWLNTMGRHTTQRLYTAWAAAFIFGVSLLTGCGEKAKEMQQAFEAAKDISQSAEKAQEKSAEVNKRREQRRAQGDTVAIHYSELQKYLPESLSGYTAQAPDGSTSNAMGYSISQTSRTYTKPGSNGEDMVKVQLTDYNASTAVFDGLVAVWALNMSFDSNEKMSKTFDPGVLYSAGYEELNKTEKRSSVSYALGGRFLLNIEASGQSSNDFAKSVAASMKLKELSEK